MKNKNSYICLLLYLLKILASTRCDQAINCID